MSQSPHPAAIRYEPAIDGLRAVAVLAVIVFHLDPRWLPGGFTGVDIFFVISGYLITRILLKEFDEGTFSIWRFYHRRVARIVPALTFVGFATLLAARFVYDVKYVGATAVDFLAAMCSVTNIRMCRQGNYFESGALATPFLHYWSLSLEEQFYLVYPLLLGMAWRVSRRTVLAILALTLAASLMACVIATPRVPTLAFYLLPFRAWELLAGSLLGAWIWHRPPHARAGMASACCWLGAAGVAAAVIAIREDMGFPGWVAILPVLATAVLIAGATLVDPRHVVARLLAAKPLVAVGRLSYSLYLTHWPVCSMVDFAMFREDQWLRLAVKLLLIAVFTIALHWIVEVPARSRLLGRRTWKSEAIMLVGAVCLVVPTVTLVARNFYFPRRQSLAVLERGGLAFNADGRRGTILLIGDSHAIQYVYTLAELCARLDMRLTVVGNPGEQFIPSPDVPRPPLLAAAIEVIEREHPRAVVMGCDWVRWLTEDTAHGAEQALLELKEDVPLLVVLTAQPVIPAQATREAMCRGSRPPFSETFPDAFARQRVDRWLLGIDEPGITVVAVGPHLVAPDGRMQIFDGKGRYTFWDRSHINEYGCALVMPDIEAALAPAVAAGPAPAGDTAVLP